MAMHRFPLGLLHLSLLLFQYHSVFAGYSTNDGMQSSTLNSGRLSSSRISSGNMVERYTGQTSRDYNDDDDDDDENHRACSLGDCMPYIWMEATIELSLEQKLQVLQKGRFIRRWRANDKLRGAPPEIRHTPIVTLTAWQKAQILFRYGNYFSRQEELPSIPPVGTREKRSSVSICPGQAQWDALVLQMTNDDELVQVVQFPNTGDKQWILDESCTQTQCSFVSNCACTAHTRLVRAMVISFDQLQVAEKYIKVYCCIANLNS